MDHPNIVLSHLDNKATYIAITNLIRFLMILGVHHRGYPVEQFDDHIDWFQQTLNAVDLHL